MGPARCAMPRIDGHGLLHSFASPGVRMLAPRSEAKMLPHRRPAKENGPISPSAAVRAARDSGGRLCRQPDLPERGKGAKIRAISGVIRRIPAISD